MRHALITFLASALGVVAVLVGHGAWQRHAAERDRAAIERAHAQAEQRGRELERQVAAEQRAIEAIRSDVVATAAAKVAVAEFYLSTGRMPQTNAEAGLPASTEYRGRSLRSLSIGNDGRIVLEFDALSGRDGGVIELVPDLGGAEAMGVQWHCTTGHYPQIVRALPSCTHEPATREQPPRPAAPQSVKP